jgi:hypothetical protein
MLARYDLRCELATFDFYNWLPMAAACGATEVVFGTRGWRDSIWPVPVLRKRFETIIAPGPALLGLPSREGDDGEPIGPSKLKHFIAFVRENPFPRLRSVLPPGNVRYTVTLRHQDRKSPFRNSNQAAWRQFARDISAFVIEDYDDRPIHLHERMALYAGAEMNFGVSCGPMFMCSVSEYPCMIFNYGKLRTFLEKIGLTYGAPMPWCGRDQITIWENDDVDTIRRHFEMWERSRARAV